MRVVIIEDEPLAREGLRALLAREADVEVIGAYRNTRERLTQMYGGAQVLRAAARERTRNGGGDHHSVLADNYRTG
ncbi:MAG: hypothetical protein ACR2MQ_09905 [Gemmatimonadaceae bacterium]